MHHIPDQILQALQGSLQAAPEPDDDAIERERLREQERRIAAARTRVQNLAQIMIANGTDRVLVANAMVLCAQRLLEDSARRGE